MTDGAMQDDVPQSVADWVAQGRRFDFNGHSVFVYSSGPAGKEGVLVVHGYPGSSWDWKNAMASASER